MIVTLNPELARFVEDQIKAGRYRTPEDVVNGALSVLQGHQQLASDELAPLRAAIQVGWDEAERGEVEEWDINDIRAEGRRLREESQKNVI